MRSYKEFRVKGEKKEERQEGSGRKHSLSSKGVTM